jgi:hypothetical protein
VQITGARGGALRAHVDQGAVVSLEAVARVRVEGARRRVEDAPVGTQVEDGACETLDPENGRVELRTAYLASEVAADNGDDQLVAVRRGAIVTAVGDVDERRVEVSETGSRRNGRGGRGGRGSLRDGPSSSHEERGEEGLEGNHCEKFSRIKKE